MKIVRYPHPALRHPAKPVVALDNELRRIIAQMLELMYENRGLGLAGPQVALPFQVFVMNSTGDAGQRDHERVLINPVINERKGVVEAEEGCLSFPGLFQKVRRARQVRYQAYDAQGQLIDEEISDLEARIVQHETDHLHGILFTDKFGEIARLSSRTQLAELEREYRRAQERGEIPPNKAIQRQLKELEELPSLAGVVL
jgi:peptide deformylase